MYMGKRRDGKQRTQPMPKQRRKGWLPPSLMSRVNNIETWVKRLSRIAPIESASMELVRFDTQLMQNPEILGVEYQQGELAGYEVREYLLEKFNRTCCYCGKTNCILEIEHITPRSRGGSDRVSNLCISCVTCNQKKGAQTAQEFGHPKVQARAKLPLRDAAAVNATRWRTFEMLKQYFPNLETGTGGRTKFNRSKQSYPKSHWIDAACVGKSGRVIKLNPDMPVLTITATGHRGGSGSGLTGRQMVNTDKFGFPKGNPKGPRTRGGVTSGDLVAIWNPRWDSPGPYIGSIAWSGNSMSITKATPYPGKAVTKAVARSNEYRILQKANGYRYSQS